jgi:hypothetical protein
MFTTHMKYLLDNYELYFVKNEWWINKMIKMMFCKGMHIEDNEE